MHLHEKKSKVTVTNLDFTDINAVKKFLKYTPITGFFNLGMVLADGLFNKMGGQQWDTPNIAKGVVSENFETALTELKVLLLFSLFYQFSICSYNSAQGVKVSK